MSDASSKSPDRQITKSPNLWPLAVLFLTAFAIFADVLLSADPPILSNIGSDLASQFLHWRFFGFEQLRQGNLALWNPHLFGGMPFFGGFQSALLYPPNWLFMILPLNPAFNITIALHVFLMGAFTWMWIRHRQLHPLACLAASLVMMFSGAHFFHIHAGHLPNLCTMVWTPLVLLAIDGIFDGDDRGPHWCLLGSFAAAMMVLAGHPQYVYYTAVTCGLYAAVNLPRAIRRRRVIGLLALMGIGAASLAAVQLLTGLDAAAESVRGGGVSRDFAALFSFPPENLLTLLAPNFFGGLGALPYWGRCYQWEMVGFVGVTGLFAAILGAWRGSPSRRRGARAMVVMLIVLALGSHTPLFNLLYDYLPGFDNFRGNSKFIFQATLFGVMLAAIGFDQLLTPGSVTALDPRKPAIVLAGLAVLAALAAWAVFWSGSEGWWRSLMDAVDATGETYLDRQLLEHPGFRLEAAATAAISLLIVAATLLLLTSLLYFAGRQPRLMTLILLLAVVEVMIFARGTVDSFEPRQVMQPDIVAFLASRPGDYRVLNTVNHNLALSTGGYDLWGYDPGVLRRYAELIYYTQGRNPDDASQGMHFRVTHPWFAMLRTRFIVAREAERIAVMELPDPLPRIQLVRQVLVRPTRNEAFAAMSEPDFDPRKMVVLESAPSEISGLIAVSGDMGVSGPATEPDSIRLVNESTDHLTIEANLSAPAVLLITDAYSQGWRARSLTVPASQQYQLVPGNHALQAVPLTAGRHRLVIEYRPQAFVLGLWISPAAVAIHLAVVGWMMAKTSAIARKETRQSPGLIRKPSGA